MMPADEPFHTLLLAIVVVVFPVMFYHRLRSHTREALDRTQEGVMMLVTLRLIGVATLIAVTLYLINPGALVWAAAPFPEWLRWTGIAAGFAGGMMGIWTVRTLGPNLTDTVVTRQNHTLVLAGPYRWVRHPFYGSIALLFGGFALGGANWLLLTAAVLVMTLLVVRTDREEERLVWRFGDAYREYMQHTNRFVPPLRSPWPRS
jgi:protein-S-isoprenylcysteine O-methyltransferase Ste14